jgi:hypothetical protein
VRLINSSGRWLREQSNVFYCGRNAMFHILNFVRLHAAELLDQSPAPLT